MKLDQESIDRHTDTIVRSQASDLEVPARACLVDRDLDPCAIVVLGATGDLTSRKLAPALYNLFQAGCMPPNFVIVGEARSEMSTLQFREGIRQAVGESDLSRWKRFGELLYYQRVSFDSPVTFSELARTLQGLDRDFNLRGNAIFYLAVPPSVYRTAAEFLGAAGLSQEGQNRAPWRRLVVEKPFGRDLKSTRDLNRSITQHFAEHQIFRIDHYLAKETVQNVLVFRFANSIFEPLWNQQFIDHVRITAAESLGVEGRAGYYEESGVLRDMFQNHMMQLLALTAMEPPSRFAADHVRDETCKLFRSLKPFDADDMRTNLALGQYSRGVIDGKPVPAYREEPGVKPDSVIPTFATMRLFVENWRWEGVPFYVTSGKRLHKKITEIVIQFKKVPHSLFRGIVGETILPNLLRLGIYPDEKINLTFQTKSPGASFRLRSVTMDFNYLDNYSGPTVDAYEKALLDCIQGDQTLSWRQDAVELCWAFFDPLLEECEGCEDKLERLVFYEAGSWGPPVDLDWRS